MAEPLEEQISTDLMSGKFSNISEEERQAYFSKFGWDDLTISSIWQVITESSCILIDYSLPHETDP